MPSEPHVEQDDSFDRIAGLVRRTLRVPTALVTLVEPTRQVFPGAVGLPEPWQTERATPLTHSFCQHVVADAAPLVVGDARNDPRLADNLAIDDLGVIAYAGMPLTDRAGTVIGSLCAIDSEPREWTDDELHDLRDLAAACSSELQLREVALVARSESARVQALIDSMPVGYIAHDRDWVVVGVNAEAARLVDADEADLLGAVLWERFPAVVGSEVETVYRRVAETGVAETFEYFYPDPLDKWYEIRVLADGGGVTAYFVDVTLRYESESRARAILAAMPVGFVALDQDFRVTEANPLGASLVGAKVEDLVGNIAWELFPELESSDFGRTYKRVARTGQAEVVEAWYPEPLNAWYDVQAVNERGGVSLFFTDVSERHRVQELLERDAAHDQSVAKALQEALLTELPEPNHLHIAAHYVTAALADRVGGDWYDALVDPQGATTVIIGDVAGHDIAAAALMGQLRSMLRAFVWEHPDDPPSAALTRLDAAMEQLRIPTTATVLVARIEQSACAERRDLRTVRWSSAGHPPPILIPADGAAGLLAADDAPGTSPRVDPLLGARARQSRHDHVTTIRPGSTLLLYTDGLIETRRADLDTGIRALVARADEHRDLEPDRLLATVTADLVGDAPEDDVATLVVRFHTETEPRPRSAGERTV